ncbi:MAG: hypothetical protein LBE10_12790, partial [Treponema sp.]|nr:hypothetical protein [Treponema sp.]
AAVWDLKDGEIISIHVEGEKGGLMENVHVVVNSRCAPDFPGFLVTAAVHAPGGAAPCSFPGLYGIDGREIRRFRSLKNRDSLLKSLDERKP